jgi:hypothetical protein
MVRNSRTLSVSIDRAPADVYAFVADPINLTQWAGGLARSVRRDGDRWIVQMPQGEVGFRFVRDNDLGVLDHVVTIAPGVEILNPMRVVPNGSGSEVLFTLFQLPGMLDQEFAEDAALVQHDLETLKRVLEAKAPAAG